MAVESVDMNEVPIAPAEFADYLRERLRPLAARFVSPTAGSDRSADDRIAAVEELGNDHIEQVRRARDFQGALYDAGLALPSGARQFGGMNLTVSHDAVLDDLLEEMGFPSRDALFVGLNIVAPALLHHASPPLRDSVLPALYRADIVGCQLFSEPGAGSDLAGVNTRAVRDGDAWILSGQKVWTSMAHLADVGEALVRTDPSASKHAGLSMFLVDMNSPGITVRPIRQMTGGAAFNEVFLDDVRVPDSRRIGELGTGWRVAATSLGSERATMSGTAGPVSPYLLNRVVNLIRRLGAEKEPVLRPQIARTVSAVVALRAVADLTPGSWTHSLESVAGSVAKLLMVRAVDEIARLAEAALGAHSVFDYGETDAFAWSEFILGAPALHIAGGTDEIQLNVIAQRGLGLPRPDKPSTDH